MATQRISPIRQGSYVMKTLKGHKIEEMRLRRTFAKTIEIKDM